MELMLTLGKIYQYLNLPSVCIMLQDVQDNLAYFMFSTSLQTVASQTLTMLSQAPEHSSCGRCSMSDAKDHTHPYKEINIQFSKVQVNKTKLLPLTLWPVSVVPVNDLMLLPPATPSLSSERLLQR